MKILTKKNIKHLKKKTVSWRLAVEFVSAGRPLKIKKILATTARRLPSLLATITFHVNQPSRCNICKSIITNAVRTQTTFEIKQSCQMHLHNKCVITSCKHPPTLLYLYLISTTKCTTVADDAAISIPNNGNNTVNIYTNSLSLPLFAHCHSHDLTSFTVYLLQNYNFHFIEHICR